MELRIETNEKFGTMRLTMDNDNEKLKGDLLYCVDDIAKALNVDLEWACDAAGRGFIFEYTFDGETSRFTMEYAVGQLFDRVCALSYNGEIATPIDWVKEYVTWLFRIKDDWVTDVTPEHEEFLTDRDMTTVYEITVTVSDIHGCVTKTITLDMFSNRETANRFIREYDKRVVGWKLEETKMYDGVELSRHNPDGTLTRVFVKPRAVFNNWEAYTNRYAEHIRKCDLNFK